jgi:hypothetical protein
MSTLDIDQLMKALDNDNNEQILKIDQKQIDKMKNDMLQKLGLKKEELRKLHRSLKEYRYIDELPDLQYGSYTRWISLKDPDKIRLTNGGIVCDTKLDDDGISVVCKNNMHRFFQFRMSECLIFQKLTDQEKVLLSVTNYLNA